MYSGQNNQVNIETQASANFCHWKRADRVIWPTLR